LKTLSIFLLLIYWSVIILAPVVADNKLENNAKILPLEKPLN
tara:strand:+ start:616 stop:741 length:126 start_codon:yes stop_codon:yes gene_type:complete